jgi:hypothetical protein
MALFRLASLTTIPSEVRDQIFAYLFASTVVHAHYCTERLKRQHQTVFRHSSHAHTTCIVKNASHAGRNYWHQIRSIFLINRLIYAEAVEQFFNHAVLHVHPPIGKGAGSTLTLLSLLPEVVLERVKEVNFVDFWWKSQDEVQFVAKHMVQLRKVGFEKVFVPNHESHGEPVTREDVAIQQTLAQEIGTWLKETKEVAELPNKAWDVEVQIGVVLA